MQQRKSGVFASDSHAYQGQAYVTMIERIASAEDHSPLADSAFSAPEELVRVSAKIGGNAHLVQGGGGNTSYKRDDDFWVKASGTWLAEAETRDIFVRLSLATVRKTMSGADIEAGIAALGPAGGLRPSIETSLHALLPHTAVLHVHSVNTIAWAAREDARAALGEALAGLAWTWVPYRRPGLPLTIAIREALETASTPPDILVLGNHGLVVGGADCSAAEALLQTVEARLALPARTPPPGIPGALQAANDLGWLPADLSLLDAIGTDPVCREIASTGALYPDHVVFLGEKAMSVDEHYPLSQALDDARSAGIAPPPYAVVAGAGVLLSPALSAGGRAMLGCLADVGLRTAPGTSLRYLDGSDAAELLGWEAEAYRRARDTVTGHSAP